MRVPGEVPLHELMTVATSGGTWSGNTPLPIWGFLVGVRCRPATLTTLYNLRIVDRDGYEIFERKGLKGEYAGSFISVPVRGVHTVYIEQATADEAFNLKLMVEGI